MADRSDRLRICTCARHGRRRWAPLDSARAARAAWVHDFLCSLARSEELPRVITNRLRSLTALLTRSLRCPHPCCRNCRPELASTRRIGGCMARGGLECTRPSCVALAVYFTNGFQSSGPLAERAVSAALSSAGFPRNVPIGPFRRPRGGRT